MNIHKPIPHATLSILVVLLFSIRLSTASGQSLYPLTPVPTGSDTLKIDTTGLGLDYEGAWPYDSILYVRNHIYLQLSDSAVFPQSFPKDSIVRISWTEIDTSLTGLRAGLEHVDTTWGPVLLEKQLPAMDSGLYSQAFQLLLTNYVKARDIAAHLDTVPNLTYEIPTYIDKPLHVPTDPAFDPRNAFPDLVESGSVLPGIITPYHEDLGMAWHIFAMQAPMAWELSVGSSDVTIVAADIITNTDGSNYVVQKDHPELTEVATPTGSGNYVKILNSATFDGKYGTDGIGVGHGLLITEVIGDDDNGSGASGICPECRGFIANGMGSGAARAKNIDVDLQSNGVLTGSDVINMSYGGPGGSQYDSYYDLEMVLVAAASNNIMSHGACAYSWKCGSYPGCVRGQWGGPIEQVTVNGTTFYQATPRVIYPAGSVQEDPNSDQGYIKPIAVGATMQEYVYPEGTDCSTLSWNDRGPYWLGDEAFVREFNFSPGLDKDASGTGAVSSRANAFIDVVAPTGNYIHAHNGLSSCSGAVPTLSSLSYECTSTQYVNWTDLADWRYLYDAWGTSHAAPLVSGVVGLMLATHANLGESGRGVHYRVYDIITMTADKIVDDGRYWGDGELDRDGNLNDDPDGIECADFQTSGIRYRNQPCEGAQHLKFERICAHSHASSTFTCENIDR